jgi:phage baseplate assembly protein W
MARLLKQIKQFRDLDLSFRINPFTKDLYLKTDEEAIKTAIKNLIKTKNFERPFHPEIGTQIHSLLFENNSAAVNIAMQRTIIDAIETYEPRVRIVNVSVKETPDMNDYEVIIVFTFKNIDKPITITTLLSRVR